MANASWVRDNGTIVEENTGVLVDESGDALIDENSDNLLDTISSDGVTPKSAWEDA